MGMTWNDSGWIWIGFALVTAGLAEQKGRSRWRWFVLGLLLGYVVILALRDEGLQHFAIPVTNVVAIIVIAFVLGVVAAVIPARRATRVDILKAIATE